LNASQQLEGNGSALVLGIAALAVILAVAVADRIQHPPQLD
jgi:adenine/guanine phosphoribosyltransferase-like PRPP-binding protein